MKKAALLAAMVVVGAIGWRALRSDGAGLELVFDRFWVDHLPSRHDEEFHALFLSGEHPGGQFSVQTPWQGRWQGFHYHVVPRGPGALDLFFGPNGDRERVQFRATACKESGFDYCLELAGSSHGARRYYSKREWRGAEVPAELGKTPGD